MRKAKSEKLTLHGVQENIFKRGCINNVEDKNGDERAIIQSKPC